MTTILSYLRLLFLSVSGMLLLCIVFAVDTELVNGAITGKTYWFHNTILMLAGSTLFMELTINKSNNIRFLLPDGLVLLFGALSLVTYDWQLNPEPEKLFFGGQLVLLWFMLRLAIRNYPSLLMFYLSIIICTGIFEACYGMMQLYGLGISNHPLFRITGTFFNPGPFCGYLAVILPLSLGLMLRFGNCRKTRFYDPRTSLYYVALVSILLILIVLPAGMSRSAWIAAAVSCAYVYICYRKGWKQAIRLWKEHRYKLVGFATAGIVVVCIGLAVIYNMKKDSADGRMLMWSITAKAIEKQPIAGVGLGGFPAAYAQTQADYFASGKATETEMMVAGCPEYAFNEFLQIGMESGVLSLLVFLVWIGYSIYYSTKSHRYGIAGSIIALMVFAFSSYPLQLPSFWVLLIFLSAISVSTNKVREKHHENTKKGFPYIGILIAFTSLFIFWAQKDMRPSYARWSTAKALYNNKGYFAAADYYMELYPKLKHKHEYLFEYSQCLSYTGNYEQANSMLRRAVKLSSDPMLFYMMAKNEQSLGNYHKSEELLLHAITILPERIYPYYLLTKLYNDPRFCRPEKMKEAANVVLNKQPKVESSAIKEMRNEVKKLLLSMNQ